MPEMFLNQSEDPWSTGIESPDVILAKQKVSDFFFFTRSVQGNRRKRSDCAIRSSSFYYPRLGLPGFLLSVLCGKVAKVRMIPLFSILC